MCVSVVLQIIVATSSATALHTDCTGLCSVAVDLVTTIRIISHYSIKDRLMMSMCPNEMSVCEWWCGVLCKKLIQKRCRINAA